MDAHWGPFKYQFSSSTNINILSHSRGTFHPVNSVLNPAAIIMVTSGAHKHCGNYTHHLFIISILSLFPSKCVHIKPTNVILYTLCYCTHYVTAHIMLLYTLLLYTLCYGTYCVTAHMLLYTLCYCTYCVTAHMLLYRLCYCTHYVTAHMLLHMLLLCTLLLHTLCYTNMLLHTLCYYTHYVIAHIVTAHIMLLLTLCYCTQFVITPTRLDLS